MKIAGVGLLSKNLTYNALLFYLDCLRWNSQKCSRSGVCILDSMLCDNVNDCGDWEDEHGCHMPDNSTMMCDNGQRVSTAAWCDHHDDCLDGSDESYCGFNEFGCLPHQTVS